MNHSQPELDVDFSVFENGGCPPDQYGFRDCETGSPLADLGCDRIRKPSNLLGALDPSYPITLCLVFPYRNTEEPGAENARMLAEGKYFFNIGGVDPAYVRYVIFRNNQFELVETEDEFRSVFAPIATPEEALGYALAVRNLSAYYNLEPDPKYEYFVDEIEDTYVEETTGGYLAHLFFYEVFGCGPHLTYAADVEITTQGDVKEISREAIYKDPSEDDLCVD
ncbi:MAG: hypothetical protein GY847_11050 [Proteobacteria bacterium]|nr:hypothetical protein [Pseudomonadota bacterium]